MVKQVNKEKLSITLDTDVHQAVLAAAEEDDRSLSSMINKILKEWAKEREEK